MKIQFTFLLIIVMISFNAFAQNTSSKEAKELKTRVLLVGLEEENPKTVKKLKGEKLELYKTQIEGNNFV